MSSSNLPLAALSLALASLYVGVARVGRQYWSYVSQKNAGKPAAQLPWTLALVDSNDDNDTGDWSCPKCKQTAYKLDIDRQSLVFDAGNRVPSIRSRIEKAASPGQHAYLGLNDARRCIERKEAAITIPSSHCQIGASSPYAGCAACVGPPHTDLEHSGTETEKQLKYGVATAPQPRVQPLANVEVLPLTLSTSGGSVEIDLSDLRPQIEAIMELVLDTADVRPDSNEARHRLERLSLCVVALDPGEMPGLDDSGTMVKIVKSVMLNKIVEPNVMRQFTIDAYTKGETLQPDGPSTTPLDTLPWKVQGLTAFMTSWLLLLTWAAFYPGLILGQSAADCSMTASTDFCSAEHVGDEVAQVEAAAKRLTNFDAATRQTEELWRYEAQMQADVANYSCTLYANVSPPGSFPDWCYDRRKSEIDRQRRESCPGITKRTATVNVPDVPVPMFHPRVDYLGLRIKVCNHGCGSRRRSSACDICLNSQSHVTVDDVDVTVRVRFEGVCPDSHHDALDSAQAQLQTEIQKRAEGATVALGIDDLYVPDTDDMAKLASRIARRIKRKIDWASDLYIGYIILGLWFPAPFLVCRSPLSTKIRSRIFSMDKRPFILAVMLVSLSADFVDEIQTGPEFSKFFLNIANNPCFLDVRFHKDRAAAIGAVCAQIHNMSTKAAASNYSVLQMHNDIVSYGATPLPVNGLLGLSEVETYQPVPAVGCGCEYPGNRTAIDDFVLSATESSGLRPFVGNSSFCSDKDAQNQLLNPEPAQISWWTMWFKSGVVADMLLKISLVNLAHALLSCTDPLSCVGGCYEVHHDAEPLSGKAQNQIAALIRYQHLRDAAVWGFVSVVCILCLGMSGVTSYLSTNPGHRPSQAHNATISDCAVNQGQLNLHLAVAFGFLSVLVAVVSQVSVRKLRGFEDESAQQHATQHAALGSDDCRNAARPSRQPPALPPQRSMKSAGMAVMLTAPPSLPRLHSQMCLEVPACNGQRLSNTVLPPRGKTPQRVRPVPVRPLPARPPNRASHTARP